MSLFDRALDAKVSAVARIAAMVEHMRLFRHLIPSAEQDFFQLADRFARLPLAVVTADIIAIAETFPGEENVGEGSPLLDHFVYLERPLEHEQGSVDAFAAEVRPGGDVLLMPILASGWPFPHTDAGDSLAIGAAEGSPIMKSIRDEERAPFQGMLRLAEQYLVRDRTSRHERRRAQRAFPQHVEPSAIVTVRLRREEARQPRDGEPEPVEWSHRWIVAGHWRRLEGRTVWVRQHVKGPPDKPLVLKQRRTLFDR